VKKLGRPTSYKPEYCQMLIDHQAGGGSYQGFAGVVGVCIKTLYEWERANPDFLHAKRQARSKHRHYMDAIAHRLMNGTYKGSATVWAMMMKNMHGFRDDPGPDDDDAVEGMEFVDG
jgi:hypothetical protein